MVAPFSQGGHVSCGSLLGVLASPEVLSDTAVHTHLTLPITEIATVSTPTNTAPVIRGNFGHTAVLFQAGHF